MQNFSQIYSAILEKKDLNAWVDVNIFRVDINFHTAIVTLFRYRFFYFDINQHQGPFNTS